MSAPSTAYDADALDRLAIALARVLADAWRLREQNPQPDMSAIETQAVRRKER